MAEKDAIKDQPPEIEVDVSAEKSNNIGKDATEDEIINPKDIELEEDIVAITS